MTRTTLAALILLGLPTFACAQRGDSPASTQGPQAAYDALVTAYNKAMAAWQTEVDAAIAKAEAEDGKRPAIADKPPTKEFIGQAQELAGVYSGKDDAVRFLGFIIKYASNERNAVRKAVETLASDHGNSAAIGDVIEHVGNARRFGATKAVLALLDSVVADNPDKECKAKALITRGSIRLETAKDEAQRKEAEKDLRSVASLTEDEDLRAAAKEALFEIENLQVGCKAPEIEGVDTDGVPFKLSDYRGKVILLDFWGFW